MLKIKSIVDFCVLLFARLVVLLLQNRAIDQLIKRLVEHRYNAIEAELKIKWKMKLIHFASLRTANDLL